MVTSRAIIRSRPRPSGTSGLTRFARASVRPRIRSTTFVAVIVETWITALRVTPATCGVRIALGHWSSALPDSIGSAAKVSSPAPPKWPVFSASISASSSTTGPRAVLTSSAPGFISARSRAPMSPRVSSVNGQCRLRMSTSASSRSKSVSMRKSPALDEPHAAAERRCTITSAPSAAAIRAVARPMLPKPTMPTREPRKSRPW